MINVSRTAQNLRFDVPKQCLCSWALYRYFSIFLCHNKMNNKIKGFMENVGFVSFVLTWPKLFQPFQLHKSNWAYVVNTKFINNIGKFVVLIQLNFATMSWLPHFSPHLHAMWMIYVINMIVNWARLLMCMLHWKHAL